MPKKKKRCTKKIVNMDTLTVKQLQSLNYGVKAKAKTKVLESNSTDVEKGNQHQ